MPRRKEFGQAEFNAKEGSVSPRKEQKPQITPANPQKATSTIFIYLFLEREEERERNINVRLPLSRPLLGTWPTTQACDLTGN